MIFKPSPAGRIGASYRAPLDIDFKGTVAITQVPTGDEARCGHQACTATQPTDHDDDQFPAIANLGIATTAITNWDLEFDVVHTGWSRCNTLKVNFVTTPAAGFSRKEGWKNNNSYRLGANRTDNSNWDVRFWRPL